MLTVSIKPYYYINSEVKDSMQNDRLSNKQSQLLFEHNMPGFNSELLVDKLLFVSCFCGLVERKEQELKTLGELTTLPTKNLLSELKTVSSIRSF